MNQISTDELEAKVCKILLNKLFVKVRTLDVFIDKVNIITSTLEQIILIAKDGDDREAANTPSPPHYGGGQGNWYYSLDYVAKNFEAEIDAYIIYLSKRDELSEDEILGQVLETVNSEYEILENSIHHEISKSLRIKFSKKGEAPLKIRSVALMGLLVDNIKIIAVNDDLSSAIENYYEEIKLTDSTGWIKKHDVILEMNAVQVLAPEQILAYKAAIKRYYEKMEFSDIIAAMKRELKLNCPLHA